MNAIELLKQQHREVEDLFETIEKAEGQEDKTSAFRELAAKLVGHDGIEREIFYPACEESMGMTDQLAEALVEHGVVEFSLYQADQALGKPDFDAKVTVLKELLKHHIEEEEKEFLPTARKALGDDSLELLGEELSEAFEDAMERDYHEPLFENLRQVLVGALKPAVSEPKQQQEPGGRKRRHSSRARKSA